jgi:hypothetical protein
LDYVLISAGIACLIAAIVGGGLKAFAIEIPLLASMRRQLLLGLLGMILLGLALSNRLPRQETDPVSAGGNEIDGARTGDRAIEHACQSTEDLAGNRGRIMGWMTAAGRAVTDLRGLAALMNLSTDGTADDLADRIENALAGDYCTNSQLDRLIGNAKQLPWGSAL